ncbi:MAG: PIN domain-containing protein [Verrucomicrobiota bacterium]
MILIDSSVWIESLRRDGLPTVRKTLQKILDNDDAATCDAVRLEVIGAARETERSKLLHRFFLLHHLPEPDKFCELCIRTNWKLRDGGLTLPWMDVMIASMALHHGTPVFTLDRHFISASRILEVKVHFKAVPGSYSYPML